MTYTYSNDSEYATVHHASLALMLDSFTRGRIQGLLPQLQGKRCLEVGAGGGSIASWLADRVGGMSGLVCAIDTNIGLLPELPNVEVLERDITEGPVILDGKGFDLVHARLVLNHLGQAARLALANMIGSLADGGYVLTQDFLPTESSDFVATAPTREAGDLLRKFQFFHLEILRENGNNRRWSKRVGEALIASGMEQVREIAFDTGEWYGGGPGCMLLTAGLHQVKDKLIQAGFNVAEINRVLALLDDPDVILRGYRLYSVSARKPGGR